MRIPPSLFALFLLLAAAAACAGEPPTAPMLRLETGFHTAMLNRIATDAQGRWLATASDDKTLRLWDIQDAKHPGLLRTFRLPSGPGDEGKLYSVAMDPAGDWLATSGWNKLGYDGYGNHNIFILDRATGQLRQRIEGLGNVINHLCVSPDGRWLAAVLGGGEGLRVYDTEQGFRQVFADRDYGSRSYGCAFSPDSRSLVTTCYDGKIRRYSLQGSSFRKDRQIKAQGGKQPSAVAFHPSSDQIAVGFDDSTVVEVVDANKLTRLYAADTSGIDNGNLGAVAWSTDGRFLFAGGTYDDGTGNSPVLRWADKGQGQRTSWQATDSTVMDLKPLPDGSLLVGTGGPALLGYDRQGSKLFALRPTIPDMRGKRGDSFQVSRDGRQVSFGLKLWGKEPVCFDLNQRQLRKGQCQGSLTAPRTATEGLKIENWNGKDNPTLNGEALALKEGEMSRSLAIAPDKQHFLLGASFLLHCFDRQGREIWQQPVPGEAFGVNISGDGKLAVAAFGDGTIRWYRLTDGEPLLALFVTRDASNWVAWTPSGWYASSPGGDSLIGWQVNNGKDRLADFFPASQFRHRFYRPDVVAAVLETLDEGRAVALADAVSGRAYRQVSGPVSSFLPPVIELLSPTNGSGFSSPTLNLRYRVSTQSSPVVAVQVRLDGGLNQRSKVQQRNKPEKEESVFHQRSEVRRRNATEWEGSVDVTLPARDTRLSLIAENADGAMSEPAVINLLWQGNKDAGRPVLYLLAVGVDDYDAPEINFVVDKKGKRTDRKYLNYAAADAQAFAKLMMQQAGPGKLYREIRHRVRTNAQADRTTVLEGLEWIERETTANDVAMVFLAGHGKLDTKEDYYFLPRDFKPWGYRSSAVSYYDINSAVSNIKGKALFLIDTCYSGRAAGMRSPADMHGNGEVDMTGIINDLSAAENGVIVLSATSGHQQAEERDEWKHGVFTQALLEALRGNANYNTDRALTVSEIRTYISQRVKTLTNSRQTPAVVIPKNVSDFPVFALP